MDETYDVVVIGAGHNGLIAGCFLARAGQSVLVVEASPAVGGMTASGTPIEGAPDHQVNLCALETPWLGVSNVIEDLGLAQHGYREVQLDPCAVYLHPTGESIAFWRDPQRTAAEIRAFSASDAEAFLSLARTLDTLFDMALPVMSVDPTRPGAKALARIGRTALKHRRDLREMATFLTSSLVQAIDERFTHPIVRNAIAVLGASGPPFADGGALRLILLPFYHRGGTRRPIGGMQALPDALLAALTSFGGSVRTSSPVEGILVENDRAVGVRLESGEEIRARRAVIATSDPRTTLTTLLPSGTLSQSLQARAKHMPAFADGVVSMKVDVALSGKLDLSRHEHMRGDGLDLRRPHQLLGSFDALVDGFYASRSGQLPSEVCVWAATPTAVDPSQAPAGQDTLYLWVWPAPLEPHGGWDGLAEKFGESVIAQMSQYYGGLSDLEINRWVETPVDLAQRVRATAGSLEHVDFSLFRVGPLRPAIGLSGHRTPVPGLYLGGAGSHPGPGVMGLPGRLAARAVLREKAPKPRSTDEVAG